jgi:hypothetical protein
MEVDIPCSDLKGQWLSQIEKGKLFYVAAANQRGRGVVGLRVEIDPDTEEAAEAVAWLTGGAAFGIQTIRPNLETAQGIAVPSALGVRLDPQRPAAGNGALGTLLISDTGAYIFVELRGFGGQTLNYYVSLQDWTAKPQAPASAIEYSSWSLVGTDESGEYFRFDPAQG